MERDSALSVELENLNLLQEFVIENVNMCYLCGGCVSACPWNKVTQFDVRKIMHQTSLGFVEIENRSIWLCSACGACDSQCPRGVDPMSILGQLRSIAVEALGEKCWPESVRSSVASLKTFGNPFRYPAEERSRWMDELEISKGSQPSEFLLFTCCVSAFDPKATPAVKSLLKIFNRLELSYEVLGTSERCCGESVFALGEKKLFKSLAEANVSLFVQKKVKKLITVSPHCFHAFSALYPTIGVKVDAEICHYVQYLWYLLEVGKLRFKNDFNAKVAYHDPCYLGRRHGVYDEPREILASIPGLQFIELSNSRETSVCCGGGGGRMWAETPKEERFSYLRIEEAIRCGAQVLAVACPYCLVNFRDAVLTDGRESDIKVLDIAEIVLEALGQG